MFYSLKKLFSNRYVQLLSALLLITAVGWLTWQASSLSTHRTETDEKTLSDIYEPPPKAERNAGRAEYFQRMLQDPSTGQIPRNVRTRELAHARSLPDRASVKMKGFQDLTWSAIGPNNVGGRTRALGIDATDSDVLIAGGASGGIWKTTDGGDSWQLQTDPKLHQSVTSLDQDPRSGHTDTWYFTTGELFSGSSSDRGLRARYYGTGVYKSTDNGDTWQRMQGTEDKNTVFNSPFDFVARVRVNPQSGSVFIASNGFGIFRSTDGETFEDQALLGGPGHHLFTDIDIADDGTIAAVLSGEKAGAESGTNPGVFVSTDDGDSWTEVTPSSWPTDDNNFYQRSVIDIAPSNTDIAYVFTYLSGQGQNEEVRLHRVNLSTGASTNLTSNLPDYGGSTGFVVTQFNYNMELAVHPQDEDFVILGGRNLWRSTDGFTSPIENSSTKEQHWIGGYTRGNSGFGTYPAHHPDQHLVVFDPNDPSTAWSAHDGGLSKTTDISAEPVQWTDMNNGYNVTQFYTVELPDTAGDNRIMGGTQDNGNPLFRFGGADGSTNSIDIAGGDGGYDFFSDDYIYQSLQNGVILRFDMWPEGGTIRSDSWAWVHPSGASGQLFIHPYTVDPNDQSIIYYPAGNDIWKNTEADQIERYNNRDDNKTGWNRPTPWSNIAPNEYNITAISASDTLPKHRLYVGASTSEDGELLSNTHPLLYRIDNADSQNNTPTEISIDTSLTPSGGYLHDIAINPENGDELIAVISNYNVPSIFYSDDGGENWSSIEGNLAANHDVMGPSVRSASILPTGSGKIYSIGTSAGLYTTTTLNGESTEWVLEAPDLLGYSITEALDQRVEDGLIAAGTHGRGIFIGSAQGSVYVNPPTNVVPESFSLKPNFPNPFNPTTTIEYDLSSKSWVTLSIYDIQGRLVRTLIDNEVRSAGTRAVEFDASGLASGTYVYRLKARPLSAGGDVFSTSRKMLLLK